ncbi:hypothetical protein [Streptomyces sp. NBC_01613]|uniref:hypothetical protein n=1 Tax=Streptomyces sp. NBC_01613 TaxID=2975896 RepID=UPI00386F866E
MVTNGRTTTPAHTFARQQRLHLVDHRTLATGPPGHRAAGPPGRRHPAPVAPPENRSPTPTLNPPSSCSTCGAHPAHDRPLRAQGCWTALCMLMKRRVSDTRDEPGL